MLVHIHDKILFIPGVRNTAVMWLFSSMKMKQTVDLCCPYHIRDQIEFKILQIKSVNIVNKHLHPKYKMT